jgi:hypothetical protein
MRKNTIRLLSVVLVVAAAMPLVGCASDGYSSVSYAYSDDGYRSGYYDDYGYYHRYRPHYYSRRPYTSFSFGYRD